jgi:phosphonate transport system substrate-binding protein
LSATALLRTLATALLLAWTAGCSEDAGLIEDEGLGESARGSTVLRFAVGLAEEPGAGRRPFGGLESALEERLSVAAQYVPTRDRDDTIDAFRDAEVHLVWLDPPSGALAREAVPGARAIAERANDAESHSYFIANRSLGLEPSSGFPMETRGLRFSFGSEDSTSGRLMPESLILKETGGPPREFYSRVGFSGSHARTLKLVNAGDFDVGAIDHRAYDAAASEAKAETLVLWKTPAFPTHGFILRPDLDEVFRRGFTDDLQEVLLELPD